MRTALCGIAALILSWPAAGQTGGLAPEWEVRKDLTTLAAHIEALKPILTKVTPQQWEGAPAGYADQGKRLNAEIDYLLSTGKALADRPEKLTVALTTYFRMQSVELMLRSYAEGIRKYQNPALAELLLGAVSTSSADREKLHQYIMDLAADREAQFRVIDEEAQRCRGQLSRVPRTAPRNPDRTKTEEKK
jgi:hypothetical protein